MTEYERLELKAEELAMALEPDPDEEFTTTAYLDPLRRVLREGEDRLQELGYLEENTGAEVKKVRDWQRQKRTADDEHLFLFLLRDTIVAHLWFYTALHDKNHIVDLREAAEDGGGSTSIQNCAKTLDWLERNDAPEKLKHRQSRFEDILT